MSDPTKTTAAPRTSPTGPTAAVGDASAHTLAQTDGVKEPAQPSARRPQDKSPAQPAKFPFLAPPEGPDEIGRLGGYRVLKLLGYAAWAWCSRPRTRSCCGRWR